MADSLTDPPARSPSNESTTLTPARPSHGARERVIEILSQSFAEDRLLTEEFERRVQLVYRATTTADLDHLVSDLGSDFGIARNPPHGTASTSPAARISAILSSNERCGTVAVPAHMEIVAILGNVELDLRRATFTSPVTHIDMKVWLGSVEITLPPSVRVECDGNAIAGTLMVNRPDVPDALLGPSTGVVRVAGSVVLGSVQINVHYLPDDDGSRRLAS